MNHRMNSEDGPTPGAHAAAARRTVWDDEPWLDHHIEELLGALSAISCLRLQDGPDGSA